MSCHGSHAGIAATGYARAASGLDEAQVSSVFHRLRREGRALPDGDSPAGTDEQIEALDRLSLQVRCDADLTPAQAARIAARIEQAKEDAAQGRTMTRAELHATAWAASEAQVAAQALDRELDAAAAHQRTDPEALRDRFESWRRGARFEEIDAPDAQFRVQPGALPQDKATVRALRKLGFENYLAQRLPAFVYGTLRDGQGNSDRTFQGADTDRQRAVAQGVAIYGPQRGFPYAIESPDWEGVTVGELVEIDDGPAGDAARHRLDRLEGFDSDNFSSSHYRRVVRDVQVDGPGGEQRTVRAWTYLAGEWAAEGLSESERIGHGDWVAAKADADRQMRQRYVEQSIARDAEREAARQATFPPEQRTAAQSAQAFAELWDDEPDEHAGFLSQF